MASWEEVHYRGGFYAYCKACGEPMSLRHAHNSDMAICYECADGIDLLYYHVLEEDEQMDYVQINLEIPINDFDMSTAQGRTDFYIFMEQKLYTEGINQFIVGDKMHFNLDINSENRQHLTRILDNV